MIMMSCVHNMMLRRIKKLKPEAKLTLEKIADLAKMISTIIYVGINKYVLKDLFGSFSYLTFSYLVFRHDSCSNSNGGPHLYYNIIILSNQSNQPCRGPHCGVKKPTSKIGRERQMKRFVRLLKRAG